MKPLRVCLFDSNTFQKRSSAAQLWLINSRPRLPAGHATTATLRLYWPPFVCSKCTRGRSATRPCAPTCELRKKKKTARAGVERRGGGVGRRGRKKKKRGDRKGHVPESRWVRCTAPGQHVIRTIGCFPTRVPFRDHGIKRVGAVDPVSFSERSRGLFQSGARYGPVVEPWRKKNRSRRFIDLRVIVCFPRGSHAITCMQMFRFVSCVLFFTPDRKVSTCFFHAEPESLACLGELTKHGVHDRRPGGAVAWKIYKTSQVKRL